MYTKCHEILSNNGEKNVLTRQRQQISQLLFGNTDYYLLGFIWPQNRYQTRRDTPMCFGLGRTSEIFLRAMMPSWSAHGTLYLCFPMKNFCFALQDGVEWWHIFTSALVKFRTKYHLSDTSGPVSIMWYDVTWGSRSYLKGKGLFLYCFILAFIIIR